MSDDDVVTRGDLETHCSHIHRPLDDNLREVKTWLRGIIVGIFMLMATAILNMLMTNATKNEVRDQRPRARVERPVDSSMCGAIVK